MCNVSVGMCMLVQIYMYAHVCICKFVHMKARSQYQALFHRSHLDCIFCPFGLVFLETGSLTAPSLQ